MIIIEIERLVRRIERVRGTMRESKCIKRDHEENVRKMFMTVVVAVRMEGIVFEKG